MSEDLLANRKHLNEISGIFVYAKNAIKVILVLERFPLSFGAWDGLRYFIVALPEPSI